MRCSLALRSLALPILLAACGTDPTAVPVPGPWAHVSAGDQFSCALTRAGRAYCWGLGSFGQLGDNHTIATRTPVAVVGDHVFTTLAVGNFHACAVAVGGVTWCWGLDDYLELGSIPTRCNANLPVDCARIPVPVSGAPAFDSITVAGYATCGLTPGGDAYCWGWSHHGQAGSGMVGDVFAHPTAIPGGRHFASISLHIDHACGTTVDQGLYCWGSNVFGQLGADSAATPQCGPGAGFACAIAPVIAAPELLAIRSVSSGSSFTCAIAATGGTFCWGGNEYGILGSITGVSVRPVSIPGAPGLLHVSAGQDHACGLDAAGAAWCWGMNDEGQLGVAAATGTCHDFGAGQLCSTTPVVVPGLPPLAEISSGSLHSCAVGRDGEIWCWGRGGLGQLGDGNGVSSVVPVRVIDP